MKITVDRTQSLEGDLIFTITIKEPHNAPFGHLEKNLCIILDVCKNAIEEVPTEQNKLKDDIIRSIHEAKEKAFVRVLNNLKFAIKNELQPKFTPICQEIYNWIYDYQKEPLKRWLLEFDPQRTTYYFDNDNKSQNYGNPNEIPDDKIQEDDLDDEE